MDGTQFDAWTRRGFGVAAGGLAGSLLAMSAIPGAEAKKGKKKKKCKKFGEHCTESGKKKCCCGQDCRGGLNSGGLICCGKADTKCETGEDCCSGLCQLDFCVCKTLNQGCNLNRQCCSGFCDTGGSNTCESPVPL